MMDLTEIVCLIDRSASMVHLRDATIEGFNTFLEEQQEQEGDCVMTVVQFDHEYLISMSGRPIKKAERLSILNYVPRGSTALFDAIGRAIAEVDARAGDGRKVIFMIITDGKENHSKEFDLAQTKGLIEARTEAGWQFAYLSADPGAFEHGKQIGIGEDGVTQTHATVDGTRASFSAMSQYAEASRMGLVADNMQSYYDRASGEVQADPEEPEEDPADK
jgi:Mg-chelatase subunit ChlD